MLRILQREDNGKKEDDEAMLGFHYPLQASGRGGRSLTAAAAPAAAPRDVAPRIAQREEEEEEEESMEPKKLIEGTNSSPPLFSLTSLICCAAQRTIDLMITQRPQKLKTQESNKIS
jgi:hypothetical protein